MSVAIRPVSSLPSGTAFARFLMAKAVSRGDSFRAATIAEHWHDAPQVAACLHDELRGKAAVE